MIIIQVNCTDRCMATQLNGNILPSCLYMRRGIRRRSVHFADDKHSYIVIRENIYLHIYSMCVIWTDGISED